MKKLLAILIVVTGVCCGRGSDDDASEASWQVRLLGVTPKGHELLTELAITLANEQIAGASLRFPPGAGDDGYVVRGNVAMDRPDGESLVRLRERHGVPAGADWHAHPAVQALHFLRPHFGGSGVQAAAACSLAKQTIAAAALAAIDAYPSDEERGHFLVGNALHTIQDSFSPAHARREGRDIVDVCEFGLEEPGACHHSHLDAVTADYVWTSPAAYWLERKPAAAQLAALKPEARSAVRASVGFLLEIAALRVDPSEALARLEAWMGDADAGESAYRGFFGGGRIGCDQPLAEALGGTVSDVAHVLAPASPGARASCREQLARTYCGVRQARRAYLACRAAARGLWCAGPGGECVRLERTGTACLR